MISKGFATRFALSVVATLALANLAGSRARAEEDHSHGAAAQNNPLAKMVRQITEPYEEVSAAEKAGYALAFGCVSGPDSGAMGLHYVNMIVARWINRPRRAPQERIPPTSRQW